tara:strand:- start:31718 stop:32005 length:288 start_codon:yes stop_codon:yes gene_type:complete
LKGAHENAASRRGRQSEAAKDKGLDFTRSLHRQHWHVHADHHVITAMPGRLMGYSVYLVLDFKLATFNVCDKGIIWRRSALLVMEVLLKCSVFGS